jgi:hypothetical protein
MTLINAEVLLPLSGVTVRPFAAERLGGYSGQSRQHPPGR